MVEAELIDFYGTECPHCIRMMPKIERLEKELNVKVKRMEVWHNEENAKVLEKYDDGSCGGVPYFYNTKTKKSLCGEVSYEELKAWATGE